jgi:hypothetical protein
LARRGNLEASDLVHPPNSASSCAWSGTGLVEWRLTRCPHVVYTFGDVPLAMISSVKHRVVTVAVLVPLVTLSFAGCITVNLPDQATSAPPPSEAVDYSGAVGQLGFAIGALAKSASASPTSDDCQYTSYVATQMESTTPAPEWQGKYESIRANMQAIAGLCASNPLSQDAINLANLTRPDVATILNGEKWLGQTNWG